MFGEFNGLPVHALVVHAVVIFAPLAAIAAATAFVAKESGEVLKDALGDQLTGNATGDLVERHQELAEKLWTALLVLFALAIIVAAAQPRTGSGAISLLLALIVTIVAVAVLVLTVQTGELGSKARWNPDGSFDYSVK